MNANRKGKVEMVTMQIMGGLGNQMFQYAMSRNLIAEGSMVKYDLSYFNGKGRPYELNLFPNIKMEGFKGRVGKGYELIYGARRKAAKLMGGYVYENMDVPYDSALEGMKKGFLFGYFQNERYFKAVSDEICRDFMFPEGEKRLKDYLKKIENENYVSLHIRRGDYLEMQDIYGGICDTSYYNKAISYFIEQDREVRFLVISNDISWVQKNMKIPNAEYLVGGSFDNYQNWYDMCIMSHCRHNIIANSTFSWWGAWLNNHKDKIVICPKRWENKHPGRGPACEKWVVI